MSIYVWNFEINTFPKSPSGFNQASPPPPIEQVQTATSDLVDKDSPEFSVWLRDFVKKVGPLEFTTYAIVIAAAFNSNILNVNESPWPTLIKAAAAKPPTKPMTLYALAKWKQIFLLNNQGGGSASHEVQTKKGVTTTDSETKSFGEKVGVSVTAGFGPVSATMSAEFSANQSTTHSISFTEEQTITTNFNIEANSFVQIWQLSMMIQAGKDGPELEQSMEIYQKLSYPLLAAQPITEAEAQALVDSVLASV